MSSAKKKATAKEDIDVRIIGDGSRDWAVISMLGLFRFDEECPCVICSGLETREAAEMAIGYVDTHGPSEVPIGYFKTVGRVVRVLREANVDGGDEISFVKRILAAAAAAADGAGPVFTDDEIPF